MSPSQLHRSFLIALASLSVLATTAGCDRSASNPGALVTASATPAPNQLAAQVVAQVRRQRTATVKVGLEVGGSGGRAELFGPVEYSPDGVHADLTGTVAGKTAHLIVLGDTVYVSQLFDLPTGTKWLKMAAGGERSSDSYYWFVIDEIVTALTYVADEELLAGLAYNSAPAETLDGVSVRTAVCNATRSEMLAKLKPPQRSRYEVRLEFFTGARIMVAVGDDAIPRRLAVTFTGDSFYPTTEMVYTSWAATTVAIAAPSGPEVRDYP